MNTSFANIDTSLGQFCLAGRVQEVDTTPAIHDRSVSFSYRSVGTIRKATGEEVRADFVTVSLTLEILRLESGSPVSEYLGTITADCKIAGLLGKGGTRDKASLDCDLAESFSAFPGLTGELIDNIDDAYAKKKRVKATPKNGRFKISHQGVPADGGVSLTCDLASVAG